MMPGGEGWRVGQEVSSTKGNLGQDPSMGLSVLGQVPESDVSD